MLSDLFDLEVDLRLSLARQFIDGVTFMHEHGVAHLDLNPSNVVVDLKTQLLRIIDFSLSIRVYGGEDADMIGYFVGTLGWTAPEVGKPDRQPRRFSATRADVWACGKVVKDLWGRGMPSPLLDPLRDVAQMLLAENPRSTPRMRDVCLAASNTGTDASSSAPFANQPIRATAS
ncbi:kinase-like protein [Rickenella mellea]|uniref:Kinase-like protein n=1 Tax=Rickenella mellea TaxID=50990 RepID=A0A4Y7Q068_9AGAM|nr:kinase-like protein [Rickenella mellea]